MLATALVLAAALLVSAWHVCRTWLTVARIQAAPRDAKAARALLERHAPELRRELLGEARAFVADRERRLQLGEEQVSRLAESVRQIERREAERPARRAKRTQGATG